MGHPVGRIAEGVGQLVGGVYHIVSAPLAALPAVTIVAKHIFGVLSQATKLSTFVFGMAQNLVGNALYLQLRREEGDTNMLLVTHLTAGCALGALVLLAAKAGLCASIALNPLGLALLVGINVGSAVLQHKIWHQLN